MCLVVRCGRRYHSATTVTARNSAANPAIFSPRLRNTPSLLRKLLSGAIDAARVSLARLANLPTPFTVAEPPRRVLKERAVDGLLDIARTKSPDLQQARAALKAAPIFDGHNDVPWTLRQRSGNVLLVHVMSAEAEINVLIGGALAFSRAALVRQHDDDGRTLTAAEMLEGLVVEVTRSGQSAMSAHRGLKIERIVVAGDTGQEAGLIAALKERFRLPCELMEPGASLRISRDDNAADPRGFSSPLGLAIAHGSADRMPFDFLNPKNPPVERNTKQIRAVLVSVTVALALLLLLVMGVSSRNDAEAELASLRTKFNELEKRNRNVDKLGKRVAAVEEWLGEGRDWLAHWASLSAHLPPATEAYVTSLKSNPDGSLVFTVKARASKVITDLSKNLREAGYDVKLGSETPSNDEFGYTYTTSVRIGIEPDMAVNARALKAPPRPTDDGSFELIKLRKRGNGTGEVRTEQPRGEGGEPVEKPVNEKPVEGPEKSATTSTSDASKDGNSTSAGNGDSTEGRDSSRNTTKDSRESRDPREFSKDSSRDSSKDSRYSKDSKDRYRRN